MKPFLCLISLFSFKASEEESGKPFQCPICGLVIKRKSYWKRHMVIHTGLKSHQCPLCPFRCARKDNLKSHMKVSPGCSSPHQGTQGSPQMTTLPAASRRQPRGSTSGAPVLPVSVVRHCRPCVLPHEPHARSLCEDIPVHFQPRALGGRERLCAKEPSFSAECGT